MASPAKSRSRSRSLSSVSKKSRSRSPSSSLSHSRSRSRSRSSERDGYRLHIADIGDEVRKSDLEKMFTPFGEIKEVWLTNSTPCFGFAVFKDKKDAAVALKSCDGMEVCGCRIRVTYARPRTRGQGRRYYSNNMRCYQCGYNGHFYRDCPEITGGSDRKDRYGRERRGGHRSDRDQRDQRDHRDQRDQRDQRDYRDSRDSRDNKDYGGRSRQRSSYGSSRRPSTDEFGRSRRSDGGGSSRRQHRY